MVFLLSCFFLFSRIFHLLFGFSEFYGEELLRGTLAKDLIEGGLRIPFFEYAEGYYHEGTLVYGLLTVPSFLLFGKTIFALRLVALFFQYGSFLTWYCFMKRFFGKREALYTALLYLFCPPWLTLYATYGLGAHAESLLFTALGLYLLYRLLYEKDHRPRHAILLGLVCGFGSYFTYGVLISTASFLLFWLHHDRKMFQTKVFVYFILCFLIGFSPWVVDNSLYHFQGLHFLKESFAGSSWERFWIIPFRFLKLATWKVISMLSFNYRERGRYTPHITFLNFLYYGVLLLSYIFLRCFERKDKRTDIFVLFPLLYLLAASVSRFNIENYFIPYFVPLFPFFFAALALGLSKLSNVSRVFQRASVFLLAVFLGMGLEGEWNLFSPKQAGLSLKYRGYSYRALGGALASRLDDLGRTVQLGEKAGKSLSGLEQLAFYHGLSQWYYRIENVKDLKGYVPWIKKFNPTYQPLFLKEMGSFWGFSGGNLTRKIDAMTTSFSKEDSPYLIQGLVESFPFHTKPYLLLNDALSQGEKLSPENRRVLLYALGKVSHRRSEDAAFLDKELLSVYYRGVGVQLLALYDPLLGEWPFLLMESLQKLDVQRQEAAWWGAGFEAPLRYEDPYEYERMKTSIPLQFQHSFEQGLKDRLAWGGKEPWIEF